VNSCDDGASHGTVTQSSPHAYSTAPLAGAAVIFFGRDGAVSRRAVHRGTAGRAIHSEAHAIVLSLDLRACQQPLDELRGCLTQLQVRPDKTHRRLTAAVALGAVEQAEFVATAQVLGANVSTAHRLLTLLLGAATSRAALDCLARDAGRRAGAALPVFDAFGRPRARQVTTDEIFPAAGRC
jgi:hypothetical protein